MDRKQAVNQEVEAEKEARRQVLLAYRQGRTVPYSLRRLLELKVSMKVVRAVYRGGQ